MRMSNMARCVTLAILLLPPVCTMAQIQSPEEYSMVRDRAHDGLRGPVKSYTEENILPSVPEVRSELRWQSTTEYDPDGRERSTRMLQSDASVRWFAVDLTI